MSAPAAVDHGAHPPVEPVFGLDDSARPCGCDAYAKCREHEADHHDLRAGARELLRTLHERAPKDVAVCAGIGLVPFVTAHKLSRAAHEARAIAIGAARNMYLETSRDAWCTHYALLALRARVLDDEAEAARLLSYARRCVPS